MNITTDIKSKSKSPIKHIKITEDNVLILKKKSSSKKKDQENEQSISTDEKSTI